MLIFGKIAQLSTDGIPQFLFYMSGNLFWGYFATCLGAGKSIFQANAGLFSRVYFPRLCVPISQSISGLFKLFIQFTIFILFYIYFSSQYLEINFSWSIIFIPFLLLQCIMLGLGTGILISSFTTKYKDLNFVYNFISKFWYYISPVVYPLSVIPESSRYALSFNPMVGVIELFRQIVFGISSIEMIYIINGIIMTLMISIIGLILFNRVEKTFIDTV